MDYCTGRTYYDTFFIEYKCSGLDEMSQNGQIQICDLCMSSITNGAIALIVVLPLGSIIICTAICCCCCRQRRLRVGNNNNTTTYISTGGYQPVATTYSYEHHTNNNATLATIGIGNGHGHLPTTTIVTSQTIPSFTVAPPMVPITPYIPHNNNNNNNNIVNNNNNNNNNYYKSTTTSTTTTKLVDI
ncbi:hypothetical protein PPL_05471 [Heterostelium album PN500]|uniref:Uncharacterized protein n=1 Tax=Heterostelium pallidum (strain ATCC 26659 / Pp 5 / PN500) TaxID=670386 RepID=D3BA96_HETP5|nr:hypothetical protein PPL_05471 [Heterostelium album PN500]EFA81483.1 hypothetical protein PPL_05471 [Heterostelium album PN500]|eukprot:XP_020433601.1 hypothetical protein PPL_05471 [Heterostelium album PN500]